MKKNIFNIATAVPIQEQNLNYYFNIKLRSFFCYKPYINIELSNDNYILNIINNENILYINNLKTCKEFVNILKTIGVKNNSIFLCEVISESKTLSKKRFYNINSVINFIFKTILILKDVKLFIEN